MNAKYSVLYSGYNLDDTFEELSYLLKDGIKVFWFGTETDSKRLHDEFLEYCKYYLLQCFDYVSTTKVIIYDGEIGNDNNFLKELSCKVPKFNYEQYLVEHSRSKHLVVKASAGTGKTSVMIDRILYLLHTNPELKPSQIAMITFTNEAADQMNFRLQDALLIRYNLTSNTRYLNLLEEQSLMNISTIHSFAYSLLKIIGLSMGYTKQLSIGSFKYEISNIIANYIDTYIDPEKPIKDQITTPLYIAKQTIFDYWYRFVELGYSPEQIASFDWGTGEDDSSQAFQKILSDTITQIDPKYKALKNKLNSVALIDMLRDLDGLLVPDNGNLHYLDFKYLFVDEFQDSDNSQIEVIAKLASLLDLGLFVVGDIKQSIYRFRGADDTAFASFYEKLKKYYCEKPMEYNLVNNYRTAPAIMAPLHSCFMAWGRNKTLEYNSPSNACQNIVGSFIVREFTQYSDPLSQLVIDLKESLNNLNQRLGSSKPKQSDKVTVLCRTNNELLTVSSICKKNDIPVVVKQDGSFFISDAVRDFYSLISSFLFHDPLHLFNYLISPYSSLSEIIDLDTIQKKGADNAAMDEIQLYLSHTNWQKYDEKIHSSPILGVINEIINSEPVIQNYARITKKNYLQNGKTKEITDKQTYADCKQYKADLDKLIEIIVQSNTNSKFDLYGLYNYLSIMINTDRDEPCADVDDDFDSTYVYCMTVHKSKGLEFDTVYIPFTNKGFRFSEESQILIDDNAVNVGWKMYKKEFKLMNDNYRKLYKNETVRIRAEECRILYVALTRAIRNLTVYVNQNYKDNTWADLLNEGGVF